MGYDLFVRQLDEACVDFPNLRIKSKAGRQYLKGSVDIKNSEDVVVCSYLIEVHFVEKFPYRFPKLFEVGDDIPREADWHKYPDGSCCITVEPDEILRCKFGISVSDFIKKYAIPYLANQYHRKHFGKYLNEYAHGKYGLIEYFTELMKTDDRALWNEYIYYALGIKKVDTERNEQCLCGSGVKFKKCHIPVFEDIRKIGGADILKILKQTI